MKPTSNIATPVESPRLGYIPPLALEMNSFRGPFFKKTAKLTIGLVSIFHLSEK